jgi:hypothetical protein
MGLHDDELRHCNAIAYEAAFGSPDARLPDVD